MVTGHLPMQASTVSDLSVRAFEDQSIADFFRRPQLIHNGEWTTSFPQGISLHTFAIAPQITAVGYPIWSEKIKGFNLCRGTARVRVQINANPFQSGKLILAYIPCASHFASAVNDARISNIATVTQLPNIELDCRDSECEILIPYATPTEWYNIREAFFDWASVYLIVLSPLRTGSGGSTTVDFKIWLSFDDFEVSAPILPQSNVRNKKSTIQLEAERFSSGPISRTFTAISRASKRLVEIPTISAVAGTVSIVADAISSFTSTFGWSKPNQECSVTQIANRPAANFPNASGVTNATQLSFAHDAKVAPLVGFAGTNVDEMSFAYLKQIPSLLHEFEWTTAAAYDAELFNKIVDLGDPASLTNKTVVQINGGFLYHYQITAPFGYVANRFALWRGGIKVRLKFVKTDYHTGRAIVTFSQGSVHPDVNQSQYVYRDIVDLRNGSEFEFTIPYLRGEAFTNHELFIGTVGIRVLNELRAPETASQTISCLMYVSAAEDFDVALPTSGLTPILPQGGDVVNERTMLASKNIGGNRAPSLTTAFRQYVIGDAFNSVKQCISRYSRLQWFNPTLISGGTMGLYPFVCSIYRKTSALNPLEPRIGMDDICYYSALYAFSRGSVRFYHVNCGATGSTIKGAQYGIITTPTSAGTPLASANTTGGQATNFVGTQNPNLADYGNSVILAPIQSELGFAEFSVPPYGLTHTRLNHLYTDTDNATRDISEPPLQMQWTTTTVPTTGCDFYRAGGDDFQFGYFLSTMPLLLFVLPI